VPVFQSKSAAIPIPRSTYRWVKRIWTTTRRLYRGGDRLESITGNGISYLFVADGILYIPIVHLREGNQLEAWLRGVEVVVAPELKEEPLGRIPSHMDKFSNVPCVARRDVNSIMGRLRSPGKNGEVNGARHLDTEKGTKKR
jgi:hypothetical protein